MKLVLVSLLVICASTNSVPVPVKHEESSFEDSPLREFDLGDLLKLLKLNFIAPESDSESSSSERHAVSPSNDYYGESTSREETSSQESEEDNGLMEVEKGFNIKIEKSSDTLYYNGHGDSKEQQSDLSNNNKMTFLEKKKSTIITMGSFQNKKFDFDSFVSDESDDSDSGESHYDFQLLHDDAISKEYFAAKEMAGEFSSSEELNNDKPEIKALNFKENCNNNNDLKTNEYKGQQLMDGMSDDIKTIEDSSPSFDIGRKEIYKDTEYKYALFHNGLLHRVLFVSEKDLETIKVDSFHLHEANYKPISIDKSKSSKQVDSNMENSSLENQVIDNKEPDSKPVKFFTEEEMEGLKPIDVHPRIVYCFKPENENYKCSVNYSTN